MSQVTTKPPKICKCGHLRVDHETNKKLHLIGNCQKCACTHYYNRIRPDKIDKILAGFGIVFIGFMLALTLSPLLMYSDEQLDQPVEMTVGSLFTIIGALIFLVCLTCFFPLFVGTYLDGKKRKAYPEQIS